MSKITAVYNQIIAKLEELFPQTNDENAYFRIPNPYNLEDNNYNFLRKGWGLKVGTASPTPFEGCNFLFGRTFSVVFTREADHVESENTETDDASLELLEDVQAVQQLFFSYNELGIEAQIASVDLGDATGVESFIADKENFLSMEVTFTFNIVENIS